MNEALMLKLKHNVVQMQTAIVWLLLIQQAAV